MPRRYSDYWSNVATAGHGAFDHSRHQARNNELVIYRPHRSRSHRRSSSAERGLALYQHQNHTSPIVHGDYHLARDYLGTSHVEGYSSQNNVLLTPTPRHYHTGMSGGVPHHHSSVHKTEDAALAILRAQNERMGREIAMLNSSPRSDSSWGSFNSWNHSGIYGSTSGFNYDYGIGNYRRPSSSSLRSTLHRMPNWIWSDVAGQWYREENGTVLWLDKYWVR